MAAVAVDRKKAERDRVKKHQLNGMWGYALWSPEKAPGEESHLTIVAVDDVLNAPPYITAERKMTLRERTSPVVLKYRGAANLEWTSWIVGRIEKGE